MVEYVNLIIYNITFEYRTEYKNRVLVSENVHIVV